MKIILSIIIIFTLFSPVYADPVNLVDNPTVINFGTVNPDGSSYNVTGTESFKGVDNYGYDLYISVSGPLTSSNGSTIPLQDLQYSFNSGNFNALSTTPTLYSSNVRKWYASYPETFMLTVPIGTANGNYTTVIYHTAVVSGSPPPANPLSAQNVNNPSLTVSSINPINNTVNVPVNQVITIAFNEPITMGSAYDQITVKNSAGTPVPITKTINGNNLTITPNSGSFLNGSTYAINLPQNSIADLNGNGLQNTYTFSFTTI